MTGQTSLLPATDRTASTASRPLSTKDRLRIEAGRRGLALAREALAAANARRLLELDDHTTAA